MSAPELKPCPFCGNHLKIDNLLIARCKTEGCKIQHHAVDLDYPGQASAWNTRAIDRAQIRADALREAAGVLRALGYGTAVRTILALIDKEAK